MNAPSAHRPALTTRDVVLDRRRRDVFATTRLFLLAGAILAAFAHSGLLDMKRLVDAWPAAVALGTDAFPPDFGRWRQWGGPILESLAMSVTGTVLGAAVALPLSALAARNTAPLRLLVVPIFNALRSVPELVLGLILVAMVGFGPLPGALALSLHSLGMLGKFYTEIIEHADQSPIDLLCSQGASRLQIFRCGVIPQIAPRLVDVTLYRWEHNFRAATIMGLVGAGGIGLELVSALKLFEYREALALLIVTLALVTIMDAFGAALRKRSLDR